MRNKFCFHPIIEWAVYSALFAAFVFCMFAAWELRLAQLPLPA